MTKSPLQRSSLRRRVVLWTTLVVLLTMGAVFVLTRSFLIGQVTDSANAAVEQEIEEFNRFATEAVDPHTGEPFTTSRSLFEAYLSRQIPDDEEAMVGFVDNHMIQMDYSQLGGHHPEPLAYEDPLVAEIVNSPVPSGIWKDVHWAKVTVNQDDMFATVIYSAQDRADVNSNLWWIALISFGGLLASIVMAWLISGQVVAPIRRLQEVASSINNSDLTQRVPVDSDDEIGHLAETFNAMLDRLELAYLEQRQFVDDAGHELRTPITVVRGQLELLPTTPPEERQRSIDLATAELDRMSRMVNDMLTLAIADSGDFVKPESVDLTELTIEIDDKASTISQRAQLLEVAEGTATLDAERITEAVLELFSNALKYSDDSVEIGSTLHGSGTDEVVRFWVRDRGQGVSKERQAELFDRFKRGDQYAARPDGAGLGLSIVKAIAEAHGGRAYIESTTGLGSIFGIEIPTKPQRPKIGDPK
ncbi:HAMP domain-containing sensor histidine kinase [Corynebacterium breve]|uniref:histidine kinase n=1 Tax=Corynebacterium breve TaxID=3049799 RepID=A0ABY8VG60_9CORY|nr:HAMP domain-containing sensor histidine kinase [Corynebacterium breve]WIM67204.1 HAMP domain-containing sensor histidine kinase [Corynebacterium breve]